MRVRVKAIGPETLKICLFGCYKSDYHAFKVFERALVTSNIKFVECHIERVFTYSFFSLKYLLLVNLKLAKKFMGLRKDFSHIVVLDDKRSLFLAWLFAVAFRKKLVYRLIVSAYDTQVYEQKNLSQASMKAKILFYFEKIIFRLSNIILVESDGFKRFYQELFSIPAQKILVLPIGGIVRKDNNIIKENSSRKFKVTYWGGFLPQHGVEYILEAAKILKDRKDILFILIGSGYLQAEMIKKSEQLALDNVKFTGYLPEEKFRKEILNADVTLGFFSKSRRASCSVGNKVFESFAIRKATITQSSPTIKHYFTHKKELYLVEPGNSRSLARAILELRDNEKLREQIAQNGYERLKKDFSEKKIGEILINILTQTSEYS